MVAGVRGDPSLSQPPSKDASGMDAAIELRPDYLYVRMSGEYVHDDVPADVRPAALLRACQECSCNRLLVDIRELTGEIGTVTYFRRGLEIVRIFMSSGIHIAVVGTIARIDLISFFETMPLTRGTVLKIFTDFDQAQKWLVE
jgi:hypothetical protein